MTPREILTQAISNYNADTFDEEQLHLHVKLKETDADKEYEGLRFITIYIPFSGGTTVLTKEYAKGMSEDVAYQALLIQFIYHSLQKLTK